MALDTIGSPLDSFAVLSLTIGAGASQTASFPCGMHLAGIQVPSGWTTAAITLLGSADNVTFQSVLDNNGVELTIQAAASKYLEIPPGLAGRVPYLILRSGTNATPVNQVSAVTLQLVLSRYV